MTSFRKLPVWAGYIGLLVFVIAFALIHTLVHPLATFGVLVGFWFLFVAIQSPFFMLMCFIVFILARLADFMPILGQLGAGKYIALSTLAILLISKLLSRDLSSVRSRFSSWMLILVAVIVLSSIRGTNPDESFEFFKEEFVKVVITFFLILNIITTEKQIIRFQYCLIAICVFLAGYALLAQALGKDPITGAMLVEGSRAGGVGAIDDPNDLAMFILLTTPLLLIGTIEAQGRQRLLLFLLLLVTTGGILSTQSRGGILGVAVGFALVVNKYVRNKVVFVGISVFLVLVLTVVSGISDRQVVADHDNGLDESAQGRLDAWESGWWMLVRNPISGVGFNQFAQNYVEYAVNPVIARPLTAHNTYIQVAGELGVPGIVAFLMLLYLSLKSAYLMGRHVDENQSPITLAVQKGALPSYAAFLVASIFLSSAWLAVMHIMFGYFAVCYNVLDLQNRRSPDIGSSS